jgi:Helicase associated domain
LRKKSPWTTNNNITIIIIIMTKSTSNKSNDDEKKSSESEVALAAAAMATLKELLTAPPPPPDSAVITAAAVAAAAATAAAAEGAAGHTPVHDAATCIAAEVTAAAAANSPPPMQLHNTSFAGGSCGSVGGGISSCGHTSSSYHLWPSWPAVSPPIPMPMPPQDPMAAAAAAGHYRPALNSNSNSNGNRSTRPRGRQGILKWESYFDLLVEFKKQHGNLVIPRNYVTTTTTTNTTTESDDADGTTTAEGGSSSSSTTGTTTKTVLTIPLGMWASTQRVLYKRKLRGHKYTITQDRVDQLTALGFPWEVTTETSRTSTRIPWQDYYQLLVAYKNQHGHLRIPQNYECPTPMDDGTVGDGQDGLTIKLGSWVNRQRFTLKKPMRHDKSYGKDKVDAKRLQQIALLNQIGFLWEVPPRNARHFPNGEKEAAPGATAGSGAAGSGMDDSQGSSKENETVTTTTMTTTTTKKRPAAVSLDDGHQGPQKKAHLDPETEKEEEEEAVVQVEQEKASV